MAPQCQSRADTWHKESWRLPIYLRQKPALMLPDSVPVHSPLSSETHLCLVDLARQVRCPSPIRVVGNHHPPVCLLDPCLGERRLPESEDLRSLLLVHLGLEAALHPLSTGCAAGSGAEEASCDAAG